MKKGKKIYTINKYQTSPVSEGHLSPSEQCVDHAHYASIQPTEANIHAQWKGEILSTLGNKLCLPSVFEQCSHKNHAQKVPAAISDSLNCMPPPSSHVAL